MLHRKLLLTLALLLLLGGSVSVLAATQGSADNPLITLSYLKTTFTETILKQTEEKLTAAQGKYAQSLEDRIAAYRNEMTQLSGGAGGAFAPAALSAGQSITLSAGGELVLREGTVRCADTGNLLDATGGQLHSGGGLLKNRLYVAAGEVVLHADGASTLLLRGSAL